MGIKDFLVSGFASPKEGSWRAMLRLEGRIHKTYLMGVDEASHDALSLIKDFSFPQKLQCAKHRDEKMVLAMEENPLKPVEFTAKFVCPAEASNTFKKADL